MSNIDFLGPYQGNDSFKKTLVTTNQEVGKTDKGNQNLPTKLSCQLVSNWREFGDIEEEMKGIDRRRRYHECQVCEKIFRRINYLKIHLRIHTGEKPYKCTYCEKAFTQLGSLKIHTRIHTGEKPYKCVTCTKCFTHSGNLKVHMRSHTGEKPYKCEFCEKAFTQPSSLKTHRKSHSPEAKPVFQERLPPNPNPFYREPMYATGPV